MLADESVMEVGTVFWATGFKPDFSWIDLSIFEGDGYPKHYRGVVKSG